MVAEERKSWVLGVEDSLNDFELSRPDFRLTLFIMSSSG